MICALYVLGGLPVAAVKDGNTLLGEALSAAMNMEAILLPTLTKADSWLSGASCTYTDQFAKYFLHAFYKQLSEELCRALRAWFHIIRFFGPGYCHCGTCRGIIAQQRCFATLHVSFASGASQHKSYLDQDGLGTLGRDVHG